MNYKSTSTHHVNLVSSIKFWIITLILLLFYSGVLMAQYNTTLYFDPTNSGDPDQDGTFDHPFDQLTDVNITSNTEYLIRRGSFMELTTPASINNKTFVRIGAFGTGEKPLIKMQSQNTRIFHIGNGSENIILDSLKIEGLSHEYGVGQTLVYINTEIGSQNIENVSITNCELYNGTTGIESQIFGSLSVEKLSIINCEIYNIGSDGIMLRTTNDVLIEGCHIYDVNMFWHTRGHNLLESDGDGIQITMGSHNWKIYNNIIDRRYTGNKFCFIFGGSDEYPGIRGEIIGNTFYPSKDTTDDQGGAILHIGHHATQYVKIERNYFCGRADNRGNKNFQGLGTMGADTTLFNYNILDSITKQGVIPGLPNFCDAAYVNNNTIVGGSAFADQLIGVYPINYAEVKNNLTAGNTDNPPIYISNVPNVDEGNNIQVQTINTSLYNDTLSILNWETSNFHRTVDKNDGLSRGIQYDFDSVYVSNPPELGSYEFIEGSIMNFSPTINIQGFYVVENELVGEEVGTVIASDPDTNQTLTYSIISGNTDNTFQINSSTGILTINNNEILNFEENPVFYLTVNVQDNGPGNLIAQATITVYLMDVNEAPEILDQFFSLEENSSYNQQVGYVLANDPDIGQEIVYSILSGNIDDAFIIDENSGELTINNVSPLNYELNPEFGLTVQVQENGAGFISSEALITVSLVDVNEAPEIEDQAFNVYELAISNIHIVGVVEATDPDYDQSLSYSLLPAIIDIEAVFHIDSVSGTITITNNSAIDYESRPVYYITVQVQDNGTESLTNQATIAVNVLDVNEPPLISNQEFDITVNLEELKNDINGSVLIPVGEIVAMDPDYGQNVSFSILSGNDDKIFSMDDSSEKLIISDPFALYLFEYYNYELIVMVEDDSPQHLQAVAIINIEVNMDIVSNAYKTSEFLSSENEGKNQFSMNIYPNPTYDFFEINLKNLEYGKTTITIFNTAGEIIAQEIISTNAGDFSKKYNAAKYRNGIYIIQICNNSNKYYSKIIKK